MNVFFVRTRLQCLIAQNIVKNIFPNERYSVVFLYHYNRNEDSPLVYKVYESLRKDASCSLDIVSADGLLRNVMMMAPLVFWAVITGGRCVLAVVDSAPIALALRFFRKLKVETFDDGAFNILSNSRLYGFGPMKGGGLKKRISRLLFPKGSTEWMRGRSTKHYTIFSGQPNIVPQDKLHELKWDWSVLLSTQDKLRLVPGTHVVILGTPHEDFPNPEASRQVARLLIAEADLYIRHPREGTWLENEKVMDFDSPAEALLIELTKYNALTVFHFNSTVGYTLKKICRINFKNLVDPGTRQLKLDSLKETGVPIILQNG